MIKKTYVEYNAYKRQKIVKCFIMKTIETVIHVVHVVHVVHVMHTREKRKILQQVNFLIKDYQNLEIKNELYWRISSEPETRV